MAIESSAVTRQRFETNLKRVDALIGLYEQQVAQRIGPGFTSRGRQPTVLSDLLRGVVVMLHASLEQVVRAMEEARFLEPGAPIERFKGLKLSSLDLRDLLPFRGRGVNDVSVKGMSIDDFLEEAVQAYLRRSNYNSFDEVAATVRRHGLEVRPLIPHQPRLDALMLRRHWIAHRADVNVNQGRGHHAAQPLAPADVRGWRSTVQQVGSAILDQY